MFLVILLALAFIFAPHVALGVLVANVNDSGWLGFGVTILVVAVQYFGGAMFKVFSAVDGDA